MWDKLDDSIDFGNFSVRSYLPLIRKDSVTHMLGLAVYVKWGLPFARELSLENSADSYLCFLLALLHSVSCFFYLCRSPSSLLCTVFYSISSNTDEILSINPSANMFVFADLKSMIKTILVELIDLVNSVIVFLSQLILLRWLTFLLGSLTVTLTDLLLDLFISSDTSFLLQWLSLHREILTCCCLTFHWLSNKLKTGCPVSLHSLWLFSCWLGWSSWSFERCSMGGYL